MSDTSCFICGVERLRSESFGYVGARRTITATLKTISSGGYVVLRRVA